MSLIRRRPQCLTLTYFLIYLPWFFLLEQRDTSQCTVIQLPVDELIPFCEYFILPYLLWFPYMALVIGYLLLTQSRAQFLRFSFLLFGGLTVCLVLYTLFHTGLALRPQLDPEKNLFTRLVSFLYLADTSTNVCPSIHTFATLTAHYALHRCGLGRRHPVLYAVSGILAALIVLSTLLLKQHSVLDAVAGAGLLLLLLPGADRLFKEEGTSSRCLVPAE
ncbi:MAG: phosphoesterase [Oscillospiraceae bacterium]|nr:phosphoesterase [Oscillospiraceae bacterium]